MRNVEEKPSGKDEKPSGKDEKPSGKGLCSSSENTDRASDNLRLMEQQKCSLGGSRSLGIKRLISW